MRRMWDEGSYSYPGRSAEPVFLRQGVLQGTLKGRQKSAEAILRMVDPSEGPNMETKGETLRFVVMAAQKIHRSQPERSKGEALGNSRRCVK